MIFFLKREGKKSWLFSSEKRKKSTHNILSKHLQTFANLHSCLQNQKLMFYGTYIGLGHGWWNGGRETLDMIDLLEWVRQPRDWEHVPWGLQAAKYISASPLFCYPAWTNCIWTEHFEQALNTDSISLLCLCIRSAFFVWSRWTITAMIHLWISSANQLRISCPSSSAKRAVLVYQTWLGQISSRSLANKLIVPDLAGPNQQ
jgi:hypothetical protein